MAQYKGSIASATASVDWHDILASGQIAAGEKGQIVVRCNTTTRVAAGISDPGTSTALGIQVPAGKAVVINLGTAGNAQHRSVWVQSPASQATIVVSVDGGGADYVILA